ncbi:MAG: NAD(P)/FAD-dependent oxidoreductase [Eggerthellaceae bacterium]
MTRRAFLKTVGAAGVSAAMASMGIGCVKCHEYDVVVVGAGVIGCCVARELARYDLRVLVAESGLDLACGASRANSGIVHAGYDPEPGTLKARYNVEGAAMFPQWQRELGFAYFQNGALVLAFDEEDRSTLEGLVERAAENGVQDVRIVESDELRKMEPNVSDEAVCALSVPSSGLVDPYGLTYAAAENAAANGVEFVFDHRVTGIERTADGFKVVMNDGGESCMARAVVNAAGVYADQVNNMVSARTLGIAPRKGEYLLYKNALAGTFSHTLFQAPTVKGKGVLVACTAFSNPFVGPSADDVDGKDDVATTREGQQYVLDQAKRTWPEASEEGVIARYAGLRARDASGSGDFVVGEAEDAPGFFNAACIDSPGLASAPAIAVDLAGKVAARLEARERADFDPVRAPAPLLALMPQDQVDALIERDPLYGVSACSCSKVSEGEIVDALHRALPVLSLDALKWRTGATMGPCHGGRCNAKIIGIVMRELGIDPSDLRKRNQDSPVVAQGEAPGTNLAELADETLAKMRPYLADSGKREAGSGELGLVGTRPAGVCAAIEAVGVMGVTECPPGTEAVVWGSHDAALLAAFALAEAGVRIVAVVEPEGDIAASDIALGELQDRNIAFMPNSSVVRVLGEGRLSGVEVESNDKTEQYACDLLIASPVLISV